MITWAWTIRIYQLVCPLQPVAVLHGSDEAAAVLNPHQTRLDGIDMLKLVHVAQREMQRGMYLCHLLEFVR